MLDRIERQFDCLIDHYIVACIFLALIILTQIGVGDMRTVSMLGLLLCVVGIAQPAAQVDLWILLPLIGFDLIGIASTVAAYGNITDGYGTLPDLQSRQRPQDQRSLQGRQKPQDQRSLQSRQNPPGRQKL